MVTSSGYLTRPSRTRGRHRKQPSARRLLLRRRLALSGAALLLAALVVSVGAVVQRASHVPVVSLPNTVGSPVIPSPSAPVDRAGPPADVDRAGPPADADRAGPPADVPFPVDDRGFVNSGARCDGTQTAVAIGRTLGSLIVICGDSDGRYCYLGVRLRDEALLKTPAKATPAHQFIAHNASVTYAISPAGLVVTAGGAVVKREPMIDYREPRP